MPHSIQPTRATSHEPKKPSLPGHSVVPPVEHGDTELAQLDAGMESGEPVRELQRM
jgi:hypothetical protein